MNLFLDMASMQELNVPEKDVEQLLVSLILDNRIDGHIDQVNRLLERGDRLSFIFFHLYTILLRPLFCATEIYFCHHALLNRSKGMKKYTAIDKWNTQLRSLYQTVSNRVA